MKWILLVIAGFVVLVAAMAAIGARLPRHHVASRTLRVHRTPQEVWAIVTQLAGSASVPVDVLEHDPPRRLVTRVKETEKKFGGTWTIALTPTPDGSTLTITEDGWVANPIFRFVSRFIVGHHATMDSLLKQVAKTFNEAAVLEGE